MDSAECIRPYESAGSSTTKVVTAYSGRGVGLDAARVLAEEAGGRLAARYAGKEDDDGRRPICFELQLPRALFIHELLA
jgi:chemotaxis protein histidine kinase CheA